MSSDEIRIGDDPFATGAEAEQERRNVEHAKWLIDYNGRTLPVTNLFRDGEAIYDPILANACVAFDSCLTSGKWLCIHNLEPGDIWIKL